MPAMRRTTRVFGMVKSYEGARVLRSGRCLWPEEANEMYEFIEEPNIKNNKENHHNQVNNKKTSNSSRSSRNSVSVVEEFKTFKRKAGKRKPRENEPKVTDSKPVKPNMSQDEPKSAAKRKTCKDDEVKRKRFGKVYVRRAKRAKVERSELDGGVKSIVLNSSQLCGKDRVFGVGIDSKGFSRFSWILYSVLRYMRRKSLELDELAGFLLSQPISGAYALLGLQFLWDPCPRTGLCKFYGVWQYMPLFSLDFSAAPHCFMYMHHSVLLRLEFQQLDFVNKLTTELTAEIEVDDDIQMSEPSETFLAGHLIVLALSAPNVDSVDKPCLRPCVKSSRPTTLSSLFKNGVNSRTIRKRRTPLKNRRSRNPSVVPNLFSSSRNGVSSPSTVSNYKLRSSVQRSSSSNLKKVRSSVARLTKPNKISSGCDANILDHNLQTSILSTIPVPVVRVVSGFDDAINVPFHRPLEYYISTKGDDEVSRALEKKMANYDADSQDEEWLKKVNNDFLTGHECVSVERFELLIDLFEKAFYRNPESFSDGKAAANIASEFGKREMVEAVYGYWVRKRTQKQSALVKVFQIHKKPSLLPRHPPRKKRSSNHKRQASQCGRSKHQPSFSRAEVVPAIDQNALLKVEEAKAAAEKAIKEAILKRQRAQALLESANLATYKATMSLRIAEFARVLGSTDAAVSHIFD
ncbi:hypothetical protein ACFE04_001483 [Oxalis oulophora]